MYVLSVSAYYNIKHKTRYSPVAVGTDGSQHIGHGAGDDKVEQPLGGGGKGDVQPAQTRRRNLRHVDPADGPPAELEAGGEEEDADEGDVAGGDDRRALLGRGDADVQADVQHAEGLGDGGPEQGAAAAERVGDEDEEDGAADHLDDAVDAGGEEVGGVAGDAEVLEDLRGVVVDGVGAGHLLADHEEDADERALAVAGDRPHLLHEVPGAGPADELALVLELRDDVLELVVNVGVRGGEGAHARERRPRLLPPVLLGQPARRLVAQHHADEEEHRRQRLHRERHHVLRRALNVQQAAVVDPEGQHDAHRDEELVEARQPAADGAGGVFRDVERVDHRGEPDAEAVDEAVTVSELYVRVWMGAGCDSPANVHGFQVSLGRDLHDDSYDGDEGCGDQTDSAAPFVGDGGRNERAEEAACLQGGDDVGGEVGLGDLAAGIQAVFPVDGQK